jgi:protein-S-isoprenylcysteine O-methyltransferase Ste14
MPLREEFVRSGSWLFRHRSYLPLVLFAPVLLQMRHYTYPGGTVAGDRSWEGFCLLVSLVGLGIRVYAVGCAPAGTSGRNTREGQVANVLNTTGLYSVVRHPLYLGNFLMWMGVALLPRSAWLAVVIALAFWLYYERIMFAEEEFLRAKFGEPYVAWASATPAFFPRLFGARPRWQPSALPFSLRNALRREYSGLFGLVASFFVVDAVGESAALHRLHVDPLWAAILLVTFVVYGVLLSLKRYTRVLRVQGR